MNQDMKRGRSLAMVCLAIAAFHVSLVFWVLPAVGQRFATEFNEERYTDGYDQLAENIVSGAGYRFYPDTALTLMREPGYPLFLAGIYATLGHGFALVKIANAIFSFLTAFFLLRIAAKLPTGLLPDHGYIRLLAAALFLFHPGVLVAESRGGVESLFGLLLVAFILTVYRANATRRWQDFAVSGAVLGVTVLVRSTPMLFPILFLFYLFMFARGCSSAVALCRNIGVMIVSMMIIISPWVVRNYRLTGKVVPTASVLGVSAQTGQYIGSHLFSGRPWWLLDREASRERDQVARQLGYPFKEGDDGYYQTFYNSQDELKFSANLFHSVIEGYAGAPLLFVRCMIQNIFNFWFAGKTWLATGMNAGLQIPYILLAIMGALRCMKRKEGASIGPMLVLIFTIFALHVAIFAQARYSIPLIPFISILASIAIAGLLEKKARPTERERMEAVSLPG